MSYKMEFSGYGGMVHGSSVLALRLTLTIMVKCFWSGEAASYGLHALPVKANA